jgi:hypothetical protein
MLLAHLPARFGTPLGAHRGRQSDGDCLGGHRGGPPTPLLPSNEPCLGAGALRHEHSSRPSFCRPAGASSRADFTVSQGVVSLGPIGATGSIVGALGSAAAAELLTVVKVKTLLPVAAMVLVVTAVLVVPDSPAKSPTFPLPAHWTAAQTTARHDVAPLVARFYVVLNVPPSSWPGRSWPDDLPPPSRPSASRDRERQDDRRWPRDRSPKFRDRRGARPTARELRCRSGGRSLFHVRASFSRRALRAIALMLSKRPA